MSVEEKNDTETESSDDQALEVLDDLPTCGIVMPISAIDGCDESHWAEVREIIENSIESAGYSPNLVSDADDVGIIHKRIIQNLYQNPIVVCDVSGKNPNVMFELGLRLAFDKPVVIIKDDKTNYSFDTSSIEHLTYPRDLRFSQIVEFSDHLQNKISATTRRHNDDPDAVSFLKHFGKFQTVQIDSSSVSSEIALLDEIQEMRMDLRRMRISERRERSQRPELEMSAELLHDLAETIKATAKEMGARGKKQARELRPKILARVQRTIHAPSHFPSKQDYVTWFDVVFNSLYE